MRFYIALIIMCIPISYLKPMQTPAGADPIDRLRTQLSNQVTDFNVRFGKLETRIDQISTYNGNRITQLEATTRDLESRMRALEQYTKQLEAAIRSLPYEREAGVGLP